VKLPYWVYLTTCCILSTMARGLVGGGGGGGGPPPPTPPSTSTWIGHATSNGIHASNLFLFEFLSFKDIVKKTLPRGGKREGQPEGGSEVHLSRLFRDLRPAMDNWKRRQNAIGSYVVHNGLCPKLPDLPKQPGLDGEYGHKTYH
jgi:hypothetical protein